MITFGCWIKVDFLTVIAGNRQVSSLVKLNWIDSLFYQMPLLPHQNILSHFYRKYFVASTARGLSTYTSKSGFVCNQFLLLDLADKIQKSPVFFLPQMHGTDNISATGKCPLNDLSQLSQHNPVLHLHDSLSPYVDSMTT